MKPAQACLFEPVPDQAEISPTIRKRVRDTSRAVYAIGRESFSGRKGNVLRWLAAYWNRYQESPTTAELANWRWQAGEPKFEDRDWTWAVLYVRRGMSDLDDTGIVEAVGTRWCRIGKEQCKTWRVREAGSEAER